MHTAEERQPLIEVIRRFPDELTAAVAHLSDTQVRAKTLADEWTVQQIVHHMVDSHTTSLNRFKLILTMDKPFLQSYDQEAWALLPDVERTPVHASLLILQGLHERWCNLLEGLTEEQWGRPGIHSELGEITPDDMLKIYADHCQNHLAQVRRVVDAGSVGA